MAMAVVEGPQGGCKYAQRSNEGQTRGQLQHLVRHRTDILVLARHAQWRCSRMGLVLKSQVPVKCPSCGKTGTAIIAAGERNEVSIPSVPDGFYVRLAPDNSVQIACVECGTPAHEGK
jgi:hypothetical protein